jgi:hypothetical protein
VCCSLAQEMSFVDRYLLYFRQWLITCLLSALPPFLPLFTEVHREISSLLLPSALLCFQQLCPLCCVLVFSSLFIQFVLLLLLCFLGGRSVCPGSYASLSQGWLGEYCVMLDAHLFGMLNVSQAGLEQASGSGGSPPVFLV